MPHTDACNIFKGLDAPKADSSPASVVKPSGENTIIYRASTRHLHEIWQLQNGQRGRGDLSAATQSTTGVVAKHAQGDPSIYLDAKTQLPIAPYWGEGGHIYSIYWTPESAGFDRLSVNAGTPESASKPCGYYTPATDVHHIVYRGQDDRIYTMYCTGQEPIQSEGPTSPDDAPTPTGDPWAFVDTTTGTNFIVYRGTDGGIHSLYWTGASPIGYRNLSDSNPGATPAAGDPIGGHTSDGLNEIVYRDTNHQISVLSWFGQGQAQHRNLNRGMAAQATTNENPGFYYDPFTKTKHALYVAEDGKLHELWWAGVQDPVWVVLSDKGHAGTNAVGRPTGFSTSNPVEQHFIYRDEVNDIYEIKWV